MTVPRWMLRQWAERDEARAARIVRKMRRDNLARGLPADYAEEQQVAAVEKETTGHEC